MIKPGDFLICIQKADVYVDVFNGHSNNTSLMFVNPDSLALIIALHPQYGNCNTKIMIMANGKYGWTWSTFFESMATQ